MRAAVPLGRLRPPRSPHSLLPAPHQSCFVVPSSRGPSRSASPLDQVKAMAAKAMDRSDPNVVAAHTLLFNLGLFAASAFFIQKYGYKLAL